MNKIVKLLFFSIWLMSSTVMYALDAFSGGSGRQTDPFQIATLNDLVSLSTFPVYWSTGKYFIQTADIDAGSTSTLNSNGAGGYYGFSPIGDFDGNYNGQGYTISNLVINRPDMDYVGLFGRISSNTVFSNIKLINCNITGKNYVGALVGSGTGTVSNCSSSGIVSGTESAIGGLFGIGGSVFSNCNSSCSVTSTGTKYRIGGLFGTFFSTATNCYSTGAVNASLAASVGGFAGYCEGATINNCFSTSNVSGKDCLGGFAGYINTNAIYSPTVNITNSYATGTVTGSNYIGCFAGYTFFQSGAISKCYSRSVVNGNNNNTVRGFIGYNAGTVTDCFFDAEVDGLASTVAGTSYNGATGKTTAQMKAQMTFIGWNFAINTPDWKIDANNSGYPYLAWQEFVRVTSDQNASTLGLTSSSNLEVAAGATLTVDANLELSKLILAPTAKVSLGNHTLNAPNGVILQSSADGSATILGDNAISNATVEQYVTAGRNWYISSPLSDAGYAELSRGVEVVEWNEVTKNWDTKSSGTLTRGRGYIQIADAVDPGTTGTLSFDGTTNAGNVNVAVTRTESGTGVGFNLVGNPYPSYLNWSGFMAEATNANISRTFWYRTKNTSGGYTFVTYNGVGGTYVTSNGTANTAITGKIPPMQAFWIRVNSGTASTTARFTNAMREHRDADLNKFKAPKVSERASLRLQLKNQTHSDETLVYFDANAANTFDNYDSPKMANENDELPELYTKAGSERLVINGLNALTDNMELPLGFSQKASASLSLKVSELANFVSGTRIYLLDKQEKTQTELYPETEYRFSTTTATTNNENRFSLLFRTPGISTEVDKTGENDVNVFVDATNQLIIAAPLNSNYAIYNTVGQQIENGILNYKLQTINCKLNSGMYIVKVMNNGKETTSKIIIK